MSILAERTQYDNVATSYNDYESLPLAKLEAELVKQGLGDCTGLRVLDLGGGSGMHARKAIESGAAVVDVVDISAEMMKIGSDIESTFSRQGTRKVNYYLGDATKPLEIAEVQEESYDLIIANWLFEHATSVDYLEGIWRNISKYAKPGARFLGARVANLFAESSIRGKYGAVPQDIKPIPGGVVYRCVCNTEPPFEFESTALDISCSGSTEMHHRYGFTDVKIVDPLEAVVVKQDPEFWKLYLEDPFFVVVTAKKSG